MSDYKQDKIKVPRFEEANGFYTTHLRSKLMSKIKGKNTIPEIRLRKGLTLARVRYRIVNKDLAGKPDIAIRKYRLAVFVDGEFWHGFNWEEKKGSLKTNTAFWIPKIERNMQRDKENTRKLEELGYKVFRFWDREINKDLDRCLAEIISYINSVRKPLPLTKS